MTKKTGNEIISLAPKQQAMLDGMDDLLTDLLLNKTLGEIVQTMETSSNVRTYSAARIIINAISELDVSLIGTIIKRVDGGIPKADDRHTYANLIGDALDDVLDMPKDEQKFLDFKKDYGIIALAKAIVMCAIQRNVGSNVAKKRDRQIAADILLSRTGGLKNEPRKATTEITIKDADWAN